MAGRKLPSPAPEREDRFDARHLSARQAEILALLMAGKANKDIARALGLGLGTIKQHLAALYKKLGVTNRATAVSRGFAMGGETRSPSSRLPSSRLLADASVMELRPTTVLSMAMDGKGDDFEGREKDWLALRGACAVATAAMDSAMVGRPGESVDIILGLHRADQDNVLRALQIARAVVAGLGPDRPLRAGLASGYLMASVHPRGGWTGEVVAGRVITAARSLRAVAEPFQVRIDAASHRLLLFARRSESGTVAETDAPLTLDLLREWPGASLASAPPRLVGREAERRLLEGYLGRLAAEERGAFLLVEGEAGMGKTTLCLAVGAEAVRLGIDWRHFRCGAPGRDLASFLAETCGTVMPEMPEMAEQARRNPIALLIDDLHLADEAAAALTASLADLTARVPFLLIVAGRGSRLPLPPGATADGIVRLARLSTRETRALIVAEGGKKLTEGRIAEITRRSNGVPLFAAELTREASRTPEGEDVSLPLALVTLILSRLDGLPVDRTLLATSARLGPCSVARLREEWKGNPADFEQSLEVAGRAGLLAVAPNDHGEPVASIANPLVMDVLRFVSPQDSAVEQFLALSTSRPVAVTP